MNRLDWIAGELAEVLELFVEYGAWTDDAHDAFVNPGGDPDDVQPLADTEFV